MLSVNVACTETKNYSQTSLQLIDILQFFCSNIDHHGCNRLGPRFMRKSRAQRDWIERSLCSLKFREHQYALLNSASEKTVIVTKAAKIWTTQRWLMNKILLLDRPQISSRIVRLVGRWCVDWMKRAKTPTTATSSRLRSRLASYFRWAKNTLNRDRMWAVTGCETWLMWRDCGPAARPLEYLGGLALETKATNTGRYKLSSSAKNLEAN